MRFRLSLFFPILLLSLSLSSQAQQLWSGVLQSSRATDWTQAGISGGLPDTNWTQCGATIQPYSGSASTITKQLAGCSPNQYVLLGAGSFTLTGQILFPSSGHVVLRGSGSNSTFLAMSGSGSTCQQASAFICAQSSDGTYTNQPPPIVYGWTGGYTQGSKQITLSGTSSINPSNPTILFLEQCETGYTASSASAPCTGKSVDNGNLFVCADQYNPSGPTGCSADGAGNESTHRGQLEMTVATGISGSVVTIANPIKYPNWAASQMPRVWIAQPIVLVGVENMAIDGTNSTIAQGVNFFNAYQWWVSGVRLTGISSWAINAFQTLNGIVQNNYIYHTTGADSYGFRCQMCSNNLVQNNIMQQVFAPVVFDGASSGDVVAYNFVVDQNYQSDYMRGAFFEHDVNAYELYEGNIADQIMNDGDHGSGNMITRFRNFVTGWDSCANGQCGSSTFKDSNTNGFYDAFGSRYENNVANVTGTAGYHTTYESTSGNPTVFLAGGGDGGVTPPVPTDAMTYPTSMFWGNYDTVTATVRWCGNSSDSGWSSTCGGKSEVALAASTYPGSMPSLGDTGVGQGELPASFVYSSKPSWWGSSPWPLIGPDVTSGNIGQCSGKLNTAGQFAGMPATSSSQCKGASLNSAWGGHVNANPAMSCFLNTLNGPPDGTGGVLPFDAGTCYGNNAVLLPSPPTGLTVVVQ